METIHEIINYSISGKCEKEGRKLQKFEYLQSEKSLFMKKKTFFIVFEGLSFAEKIKT